MVTSKNRAGLRGDGRRLRADLGSIAGTRPVRMELQSTRRRPCTNAPRRILEVARAQSRKRRHAPGHDPMTDHLGRVLEQWIEIVLGSVHGETAPSLGGCAAYERGIAEKDEPGNHHC